MALATVAATSQIIGTVTSFFERNYNPTNDLILSIGDMVEALNLKVDAVFERIELLHDEVRQLRSEILEIPIKTVSLSETYVIRGIIDEAEDALKSKELYEGNLSAFYDRIEDISERLRSAIYRYMNISADNNHDAFVNVALACDSYFRVSLILLQVEAVAHQVKFSAGDLITLLQAFENYLKEAIGDEQDGITLALTDLQKELEDSFIPTSVATGANRKKLHIGSIFQTRPEILVRFTRIEYPDWKCHEYDREGRTCLDPDPGRARYNYTHTLIKTTRTDLDMSEFSNYPLASLPFINSISAQRLSSDVKIEKEDELISEKQTGSLQAYLEREAGSYDLVLSKYLRLVFVHSSMKRFLSETQDRRKLFSGVFS